MAKKAETGEKAKFPPKRSWMAEHEERQEQQGDRFVETLMKGLAINIPPKQKPVGGQLPLL